MRTSNKLLLIFFLASLGFFVVVNLALRIKYDRGNILSLPDPDGEMVTQPTDRLPVTLSLHGNMNVRIIPSDTFSLQWEHRAGAKFRFNESGDSLSITEEDPSDRDPHAPWQNFADHPWVFVYCGHLQHIQLSGLVALLRGTRSPGSFRIGLDISNTQLCLGEPDYDHNNSHPPEYYDSVVIHSVNGNLQLFRNTVARDLFVQLDDRSEIRDLGAQIDSPRIRYADSSQIHLTGRTLRKIK
jgi:hypothetical protein